MSVDQPALRIGRYRWVICGLLFAATAINYIDRQTIGVLKPTLQAELRWTEPSYADIVFWFQCAYAIGYLSFGPIFALAGSAYIVAIVAIHCLSPKLTRVAEEAVRVSEPPSHHLPE